MNNLLQKQDLSTQQLALVQSEFDKKKKSKGLTYGLWWFTCVFGGHRFYLGNIGMGIGMLLTFGGLGIWALIDLFLIGSALERKNEQIENDIIQNVKLYTKENKEA